jgi:hypothetical protein
MPTTTQSAADPNRRVLFTLEATAAQRERLRAAAEARGQSMAALVREGLAAVGVYLAA